MKPLLTLMLLVLGLNLLGQDKIIKKNGDVLNCVVTALGSDQINYHYTDRPGITFGIDKALVDRIEFASGEVIKIEENTFNSIEYYANQNQRALKLGFLSPMYGNMEFTYEQVVKPGRSWEAALGIIGIGLDPNERNPSGAYGKVAYKLTRTPDYYMHRMHYSHILKGAYLAPEIAFRFVEYNRIKYNWFSENTYDRVNDFSLAIHLKFGKQWVFNNMFIIDSYIGIGYGTTNQDYDMANYGFAVMGSNFPVSFTSGIRIGFAF